MTQYLLIEQQMIASEVAYYNLKALIEERQQIEAQHRSPPYERKYAEHKTDYNYFDVKRKTLLQYAAILGDLEKVKECLSKGAYIDFAKGGTQTAIALALQNGHGEVAKYLYNLGADCSEIKSSIIRNDADKEWFCEHLRQALHQSYPDPTTLEHPGHNNPFFNIDDYFNTNNNKNKIQPLERAVELGDITFLRLAIETDAFKAARNHLLVQAIVADQLDIVKFLLENGASVNPINQHPIITQLIAAIEYASDNMIDYLIENKADIDAQDSRKMTPLMYAIGESREKIVNKLLDRKANITALTINGRNMLHVAAKAGSTEMVKRLLEFPGAKELINQKDMYGYTPIDIAKKNKHDEIIKLFLPDISLDIVKQSVEYGDQPISIKQGDVIGKMLYFLVSQRRNTQFLAPGGQCNGFSYLYHLSSAKNPESYYFDTLKLMSMWDGSEKTLYASLIDQPQYELYQKYGYKNLSDLFEQWINDLIWFQHAELSEIDAIEQEQRVKQYPTISDDEEYQYVPLYQETMRIPKGMSLNLFGKITESLKRSNTQIQENSTSGSGLAFC